MPSILLFGATGEMGSHLVIALKKTHPSLPLTVYLRNSNIDTYMTETVGVDRIEHGDNSESEKVSALAREHDVVINIASSMDVPFTKAIVKGLRGKEGKSSLIHISGAGNFIDGTREGKANPGAKVWSDDSEDDMKLINPSMLNGGPDVEVFEAGKDGKIATYIIFPSGTYGASTGPVQALGVIQLLMTLKAKELGFVPYVGEGNSIFNTIHVLDIQPFILKVLDLALSPPTPETTNSSPYTRTYIIGSQNNTWKEVSTAFAKVLHAKGVIESPEPRSIRIEDGGEGEIVTLMGTNMAISGKRAERLGFRPVQKGLLEGLEEAMAPYDL